MLTFLMFAKMAKIHSISNISQSKNAFTWLPTAISSLISILHRIDYIHIVVDKSYKINDALATVNNDLKT